MLLFDRTVSSKMRAAAAQQPIKGTTRKSMRIRSGRAWIALALLAVCGLSACSLFSGAEVADASPNAAQADTLRDAAAVDSLLASLADTAAAPKRLPTLREMMRSLDERQTLMQTDISAIRSDLASLRRQMDDLSALVNTTQLLTNTAAVKGDPPPNDSLDYLLPDATDSSDVAAAAEQAVPDESSDTILLPDAEDTQAAASSATTDSLPDSQARAGSAEAARITRFEYSGAYKRAQVHIARKEFAAAIDSLELVLKSEDNAIVLGRSHYWLGEAYFGSAEYRRALPHFIEFLATDVWPDRVEDSLKLMGISYLRLGNTVKAKETFQRIKSTFPQGRHYPFAERMLQQL